MKRKGKCRSGEVRARKERYRKWKTRCVKDGGAEGGRERERQEKVDGG